MDSYESLLDKLGGQSHVLQYWDELEPQEKEALAKQIGSIDIQRYESAFKDVQETKPMVFDKISPILEGRHVVKNELDQNKLDLYWQLGIHFGIP